MLGDKACCSAAIRLTCAGAASPPPSPSRPPAFDPAAYKQRNTIERTFGQLRRHRAVATRYDKRNYIWRDTVDIATIKIWLRDPTHDLQDTL